MITVRCIAGMLGAVGMFAPPVLLMAADKESLTFQGTINVSPELAHHIDVGDRLIMKLYHPGENGLEMDAKFQIADEFSLPVEFRIGPSISMSGDTKHQTYVVEVFTDKDRDVLSVVPGELIARTPEPLPLGTKGIVLELILY